MAKFFYNREINVPTRAPTLAHYAEEWSSPWWEPLSKLHRGKEGRSPLRSSEIAMKARIRPLRSF
ncbi:hypothetical protein C1H46_013323 [Malus baccata]|uniref:Uncharacterized protein n=1 Tax=Malus baccata TaxID=106549 RepID=A0A540MQG1_MALBA|nr:hypothetical protein C1H46_013323 [Malus baccata]